MNNTNTNNDAARDAGQIETHNNHAVTDYVRDGLLQPECVNVRLTREESGIYDVEISILDRDFTFEDEVASAVAKQIGGRVRTSGRGNGISVTAPKGFRAKKGFVKVEAL